MADLAGIAQRFDVVRGVLDERSRRLVAAAESVAAGRGGVSVVARATGMSRQVIRQGVAELGEAMAQPVG
jgi:DNA-binding phage protein